MYYSDFFESGINNLSAQNSVHLSPEELAAIDHGIMSAYGNRSSNHQTSNGTPYTQNQNQNQNQNSNMPTYGTPYTTSTPFMNDYFKTPTPMTTAAQQNDKIPFMSSTASTPYTSNPFYSTTTPYNNNSSSNNNNNKSMYANMTPHFGPTPPQSHKNTGSVDENLVKSYENRIQSILRDEREKFEKMEAHYRNELDYLKTNDLGYSERLKLEQTIQDLRNKIERLERSNGSGNCNNNNNFDVNLKQHYDAKISKLIKQFEQEKSSALEIMKTRAKSEINLFIPKIKAQVIQSMERAQAEKMDKFKIQVGAYIKKMKKDWESEREILVERLERRHAEDIKNIQKQMQVKYELKLQEEKKKMMFMFENRNQNRGHSRSQRPLDSDNRYSNDYGYDHCYGNNNNNYDGGFSSYNNKTPYYNNNNNMNVNNQIPNSSFFESSFLL